MIFGAEQKTGNKTRTGLKFKQSVRSEKVFNYLLKHALKIIICFFFFRVDMIARRVFLTSEE